MTGNEPTSVTMIYLDHNATTPLDPAALEAMQPFLGATYANPAAGYRAAEGASRAVEAARCQLAGLLGGKPEHWTFTSGATEALALAIGGFAGAHPERRHLLVSAVEHPAARQPCELLARLGFEVSVLPVPPSGRVEPAAVRERLRPGETLLLALMHANNETGVLQPVEEIASICREQQVMLLCDASQSAGKIPLDVPVLGVDALAISGHKFHGPKGVGALYLRPGVAFHSPLVGGGHQRGRRGGTLHVPGIVGLGVAAELAQQHLAAQRYAEVETLRDRLEQGVRGFAPETRVNGNEAPRLPTTSSLSFPQVHAEALMQRLDDYGICVAAGAACHTNAGRPSDTLQAMQIPASHIRGTLRFSLGRDTSEQEIETVLARLPRILAESAVPGRLA